MSTVLTYPTGSIELRIELGIGRQAQAGVWDSGSWDFSVWAATDTSLGDWVDVTCDVLELDITGGASEPDAVITSIDATTGSFALKGAEWNPWSSAYAGVLGPQVPVRISWRRPTPPGNPWKWVFTGRTDGWPFDRKSLEAKVPLVDATAYLASYITLPLGASVGDAETIAARIGRILDSARWTGLRDIGTDSGAVHCIATLLAGEIWGQLTTAADTDLGIIWLSRAGAVSFRPVAQVGQWSPAVSPYRLVDASSSGSDVCVVNYVRRDPQVMRNDVSIAHAPLPIASPPAVPVVRITDDASIARYLSQTYSRTDLIHNSDTWSSTVAYVILQSGAWPHAQPQVAELDIRADTHVAELLLDTEIATTITALDGGRSFRCVVVGYAMHLDRKALAGSLVLQDVTQWVAGVWDTARWGIDRWGV